jgi:hypothetical protein
MQDRNTTTHIGAQYNQKMLFLEPPPLNCKSISVVVKAQNGSSSRLPDWLDCWVCHRAPLQGGREFISVNDAQLPVQAAITVVGAAMQASPSNVPVMLTTAFTCPSPPLQGHDGACPPLAITSTWWRAAITPMSLAPLPVAVCYPVLCCALIPCTPSP